MAVHKSVNSEVVELLKVLKSTAVPRSVDSGEAITYRALKDTILDNAILILDALDSHDAVEMETALCVDHQKLASAVLERTFDAHTQVMRQKLKEAEEEAEMWRKVTLFGRCRTVRNSSADVTALVSLTREQHRCTGTQTCTDENASDAAQAAAATTSLDEYTAAVQQWFAEVHESSLSLFDAKVALLCTVHVPISPGNQSPLENSKVHSTNDSAADSGKLNRVSPATPISDSRSPVQKTALKGRVNTPLRRTAASPVAPIRSPASKSPTLVPKLTAPPLGKRDTTPFSPRQDTTTLNQVARSFDGNGLVEPLYVLQALQLKSRNSVCPSVSSPAGKSDRSNPPQHLPQL